MGSTLLDASAAVGLALAVYVSARIGIRLGRAAMAANPEHFRAAMAPIETATFTLLSLLVAFTFNGAASRFEFRRTLIAQEANAIDTAYRRLDILAEGPRLSLQAKFRAYLTERLAAYRAVPDFAAVKAHLARSQELQDSIWQEAVPAAVEAGGGAPFLVIGALNVMFDITTTRLVATEAHPPSAIFWLLAIMAVMSGLMVGHAMARNPRPSNPHLAIYALMLSGALFVILDLEYPRLGLIRIDEADQTLVHVLERMRPP